MLLPVGDEPNADETPWATYFLMAANIGVWLLLCWPKLGQPISLAMPGALDYVETLRAQVGGNRLELLASGTAYDVFMFRWGYRPASPHVETLLTCLFLHGGWMHLFGNMLFLYVFGDNVEARLGPLRYVCTYLICGVVATLFYAAFRLQSGLPLVGASGAISGVLGCYFVWFPRNRVKVLYSFFFFIERAMVPARVVLLFYFVMQNLLPFLLGSAGLGGTAYGAHLGGFLAGAGYAWYDQIAPPGAGARARRPGEKARWGTSSAFSAMRDVFERRPRPAAAADAHSLEEVRRLLSGRHYAQALAHFYALPKRERLAFGSDDVFALADHLTEQRRFDEALALLRGAIGRQSAPPAAQARAHLRMGLIYLRGLTRPAAAYPHLLDALELPADDAVKVAARQALAEIESR